MTRLDGKVAIITGAAKGLGEAGARLLAAAGATVILADTDIENGARVAREIGGRACFKALDVTRESDFAAVIAEVMASLGRLDILVNNAGVVVPATPESITEADYRAVLAVSLDGTVFGCKHAIPALRASGGGSIINMASVASIQGIPYAAAYSAAKGGVEAYTRTVAVYCKAGGLPIRCNSIHPSAFATPMMAAMPKKMQSSAVDAAATALNARRSSTAGDPQEVARLVLFLASDESSYITGQRFVIDNGGVVTPYGMAP